MASFLDNILSNFRGRRVAPTETIGSSGTQIVGGFVVNNEKNAKLQGMEKYKTFSEILANTSIVAAGTRYFLNLISKAKWKIEPADDTPQALEIAEKIEQAIFNMETPWHRVVRRAAMYRFYGFSIQEWTAIKNDDGFIGLLDIAPRPQVTIERWDVDLNGKVQGILQRSPQSQAEIYLPRAKTLYVVDDTLNDSPEGLGLFRNLVEPTQRLKRYEELEGFGFETDLRGVPVGRAPFQELQEAVGRGELSPEEKTQIEGVLETFIKNHIKNPQLGLVLDSAPYRTTDDKENPSTSLKWGLDLLTGSGTSLAEIALSIERVNREIARILGVESLLLGDGKGSFALSKDKSHNFALIVDSTLTELSESFDADIGSPLIALNGWDPKLKPTFKPEAIQYKDIEQITGAIRDLALAGAMIQPNDPAVGELYDLLGLTRPIIDETNLTLEPEDEPDADELDEDEIPDDDPTSKE